MLWVINPTLVMPELTILERAKSIRRYLPPNGMLAIVRREVSSGMHES